jgi:hypothetical protein
MNNLVRLLTVAFLVLGITSPSLANSGNKKEYYNKKVEQFKGDTAPENCPENIKKQGYFIYNLCQVKGKPIYVQISSTEASEGDENGALDVAIYEYKNGQLIQVSKVDFERYGFRNNKLVAGWNLDTPTINVSLPKYRNEEKRILAESRRILNLFGIKQK